MGIETALRVLIGFKWFTFAFLVSELQFRSAVVGIMDDKQQVTLAHGYNHLFSLSNEAGFIY